MGAFYFMSPLFIRGDANIDLNFNVADVILTLTELFAGDGQFACDDAVDSNDDGLINIADAIFSLSGMFAMGELPPHPYPSCGGDPSPDGLDCAENVCP